MPLFIFPPLAVPCWLYVVEWRPGGLGVGGGRLGMGSKVSGQRAMVGIQGGRLESRWVGRAEYQEEEDQEAK